MKISKAAVVALSLSPATVFAGSSKSGKIPKGTKFNNGKASKTKGAKQEDLARFSLDARVGNSYSMSPTISPTTEPTTLEPTLFPTLEPTLFLFPTISPTFSPTLEPTLSPTLEPTLEPTFEPTFEPTLSPILPSAEPSGQPSSEPSSLRSAEPSSQPSSELRSLPLEPVGGAGIPADAAVEDRSTDLGDRSTDLGDQMAAIQKSLSNLSDSGLITPADALDLFANIHTLIKEGEAKFEEKLDEMELTLSNELEA